MVKNATQGRGTLEPSLFLLKNLAADRDLATKSLRQAGGFVPKTAMSNFGLG